MKIKKITLSNLEITVYFNWIEYYVIRESLLNPGLYSIEFYFYNRHFDCVPNWSLPAKNEEIELLRKYCKKETTRDKIRLESCSICSIESCCPEKEWESEYLNKYAENK